MRLAHPRLLAVLLLSGVAAAQGVHKDTRLGFSFKPPKDYQAIALEPREVTTVAKYQDPATDSGGEQGMQGYNRTFEVDFFPMARVRQDEIGENATGVDAKPREMGTRTVDEWWEQTLDEYFGGPDIDKDKPLSLAGAACKELQITMKNQPLRVYVVMVPQDDGVFLMRGAAIAERFDKASQDFAKAAKSFKRIPKADDSERQAALSRLDEQERFLQEQIDRLPAGWGHLRTKRYLFLFDADKNFVEEMADQVEALRNEYERLYPPDKPITAVSIVRVCKNVDEYQAYGGSAGTGGYWNYMQRELVFFDQSPRDETLCVLNHEAFHQYIYYYYGQLSPHSWYNEGHGDYFSGARMTKSYRITSYANAPGGYDRLGFIKEMALAANSGKPLSQGALVPLKKFLNYTKPQYYDEMGGELPVAYYPQGWAFVHMLRESKNLDPKWKAILPDYLQCLLAARHEVATEMMNQERETAEKVEPGSSAEIPSDPAEWYTKVDVNAVQSRAYDKTFKDWTDGDWKKLDAFFLTYIEKL
jgi:hypothetical protein